MKKDIENAKIDLISELGVDQMPKEKQEEILAQMGDIMQQRIIERFVQEIPEEEQDKFLEMISSDATEQSVIDDFITQHIPQSEDLILEEIGKYKEESIKLFQQIAGDSE